MPGERVGAVRRPRRIALVSWVVCAALAVAIVAMNAAPVSAQNATVSVGEGGNLFVPNTVTVSVGSSVTWTWVGGFHNVVAADGSFTSGAAHGTPGESFTATFSTPGTFFYYCEVHAPASAANDAGIASGQMVGKVVVQAAQASPTATETATQAPTGTATAAPTGTATSTAGTATPTVPKTGQGGLVEESNDLAMAMLFIGLAVATVAGARMLTQRPR